MTLSITHNSSEIIFTVELRARRTTTIQVHRDGSVRVLAPKLTPKRLIMKQVSKRADWILKKQKEFSLKPRPLPKPEFRAGDIFSLLGNELVLETETGRPAVRHEGGRLLMTAPAEYDSDKRRNLMRSWYRREADAVFAERLKHCVRKASVIGIKKTPEFKSRVLKRSWGSCSPKGRINLNLELVSAPPECIDYVILHELCHLKEHNHSPAFYRLMDKVCPDWKKLRDDLNSRYNSRLA